MAKTKVAVYCRVSTDKDDQANSFEAQQRYFREYIDHQPEWEFYDIYADEGITGTNTRKRHQFRLMIEDARQGKFELIVTKEVSRFARNTVDALSYTRELRALGIGVVFALDGINTLDPDAELRLSIMATIAQDESRKTSERVRWGQQRQMERGVVFGASMLGYDVHNGEMTIDPEGAELVRKIYQMYTVEQMGTTAIAKALTAAGYPTYHAGTRWSGSQIVKVLKNKKYVGDLTQRKTYTKDYLTHERAINHGQVAMIELANHHPPIIDRGTWEQAQQLLSARKRSAKSATGVSSTHALSGKIKCGVCGKSFVARHKYRSDGSSYLRWSCATGRANGCDVGRLLRDDMAQDMVYQALSELSLDTERIISGMTEIALDAIRGDYEVPVKIDAAIQRIKVKRTKMMDCYFNGDITRREMIDFKSRYDKQIDDLLQKNRVHSRDDATEAEIRAVIADVLTGKNRSDIFSKSLVRQITVYRDGYLELSLNHVPTIFYFQTCNG